MSCRPCAVARLLGRAFDQYADNLALALDRLLNAILGGFAGETISRRIARARKAGEAWAARTCRVLTFLSLSGRDHCAWSLAPGTSSAELVHWSPPDGEVPSFAWSDLSGSRAGETG